MGTTWSVACAGAVADGDRLRVAVEAKLADLVGQLSHWEPRSAVGRFNRAPPGRWEALPPDLATVMAAALDMAALSGGAFDPAIGRIVDLLGFGPPGPQSAPLPAALAEARARSGVALLAFDRDARRLRQPGGLALDLSGIAKGHAVDAIGAALDAIGARDWLVEIGGELKGRGMRPDAEPWWVDLEAPPGLPAPPLRVALHGLAVATSGDYRRGAHTIDPRTARSVDRVRAASVLHAGAMLADAWATVLTVLGPDEGLPLAEAHRIAARLIVEDEPGMAVEHLTAPLRAMLED